MDFTREPLIETVITSREGHKLVLRNSKTGNPEGFSVEAVEVVSFGRTAFYRSLEKSNIFLVPVADYEMFEIRDARVVLKSATVEHGIKIAGGKEGAASAKAPREEKVVPTPESSSLDQDPKSDKRRERRRGRKAPREVIDTPNHKEEGIVVVKSPERSSLIPPPSTLISETLSRYREQAAAAPEVPTEESVHEEPAPVDDGFFEEFLDHYISEEPSESDAP